MKNYKIALTTLLLATCMASLPAQSTVSRDIYIGSGEEVKQNISSVSGDIFIGKKAEVKGTIITVSGDVEVGAKANLVNIKLVSGDASIGKGTRLNILETVSGDVLLYGGNKVKGSVNTVSGDVVCKSGSSIGHHITTVSGDVELDDTSLGGDLSTVSGDISLYNGSVIEGDINIKRSTKNSNYANGKLKVIIDLNSVVKGSIRVTEPNTNVIVYLSNGGEVEGDIINAEVRKQ